MIVKVCGMRYPENIREVEMAGADWIGFIFHKPSLRFLEECPAYLPQKAKRVGVFVNAPIDFLLEKTIQMQLDYIQLHGQESPEYCMQLQQMGLRVIKVFSLNQKDDLIHTEAYSNCCEYFLFDTPCPECGGSGKTFDWQLLASYRGKTPFLLSGGISPKSMEALATFRHPQWAGIDVNSGFEQAPARKKATLLHTFIIQFRKHLL